MTEAEMDRLLRTLATARGLAEELEAQAKATAALADRLHCAAITAKAITEQGAE